MNLWSRDFPKVCTLNFNGLPEKKKTILNSEKNVFKNQ